MTIQIGDRIPDATLAQATAEGPSPSARPTSSPARPWPLFAVPGAFTPTCSARHLPGFKDHLADIQGKGVDTVACLSVNDAFVMKAWGESQGHHRRQHHHAGRRQRRTDQGPGPWCWTARASAWASARSANSMLVKDGVVTQLNIEQGGEFKVSSARASAGPALMSVGSGFSREAMAWTDGKMTTDVFSPEKRSAVMRRVKGGDTSPELAVRKILRAAASVIGWAAAAWPVGRMS